jgi:hypothetical protein
MNSEQGPDNSFRQGDPRRIDVTNPTELAYWCKCLGVGETDLIATVRTVGSSAQSVKEALRSRRQGRADEGWL